MFNLFTKVIAAGFSYGPSLYYASACANVLINPSRILKTQEQHEKNLAAGGMIFHSNISKIEFKEHKSIRQDIKLVRLTQTPVMPYAAAVGTNFGPEAIVLVDPFFPREGGGFDFVLKHELSHINTNDGFISSALGAIASLIATLAIPLLKGILPWWCKPIAYIFPYIVAINIHGFAMQLFEFRADSFALKYSTDAELKGAREFLMAQIEVNKEIHKQHKFGSADGNAGFLRDPHHPPYTVRLERINRELERRNIQRGEKFSEYFEIYKDYHRDVFERFSKLSLDTLEKLSLDDEKI